MAETLNMIEKPISEIIDFIKDQLECEIYDPIIILGKMGMGKTASLKGLAKDLGIGYCELRLVNMTETDMLGIPTVSAQGTTTYASNDLLPIVERDGEVGILALDEITSCSSTMRAAAYQLLDGQRALGNYKLPEKWICVGLGNGPDDGGVFNGAEAALFTRCYGFRVAVSIESWKEYALANNINPAIIAYLSMPGCTKLHDYDPDEMDGLCPTPRTWEKLSKLLNSREAKNGGKALSRNMVEMLAAASIGEKEAGAFAGFYGYKASEDLIDPNDIVSGKAKGKNIRAVDPEVIYLTIQNIIQLLRADAERCKVELSDDIKKKIVNACAWFVDIGNQKTDYGVMGIRDIMTALPQNATFFVLSEEFDELCPEVFKFAQDKDIMLS